MLIYMRGIRAIAIEKANARFTDEHIDPPGEAFTFPEMKRVKTKARRISPMMHFGDIGLYFERGVCGLVRISSPAHEERIREIDARLDALKTERQKIVNEAYRHGDFLRLKEARALWGEKRHED